MLNILKHRAWGAKNVPWRRSVVSCCEATLHSNVQMFVVTMWVGEVWREVRQLSRESCGRECATPNSTPDKFPMFCPFQDLYFFSFWLSKNNLMRYVIYPTNSIFSTMLKASPKKKNLSVVSTVKLVHCWTFFILEGSASIWLGVLSHIAGFPELCVSTHTLWKVKLTE